MKRTIRDIILVIIGSFIFAAGVNAFVISGDLGEEGVTGLAIILYYAFHISPAWTNFIVNAVLIAVGYKFLSKRSMYLTILATVLISIFLSLTEPWHVQTDNILVNAIFGGSAVGLGIGIIILAGGTTAGTTILAGIANKYLDASTPYALLFFDVIVVLISLTVIPLDRVLVTLISLYIGTKVIDFVIEGLNPKKAVTIISKEPDRVAKMIDEDIGRGVTILNGRGYFSKQETDVLYAVISKTQLSRTKRLIRQIDKNAFVVVHDVRDVYGNGFLVED